MYPFNGYIITISSINSFARLYAFLWFVIFISAAALQQILHAMVNPFELSGLPRLKIRRIIN